MREQAKIKANELYDACLCKGVVTSTQDTIDTLIIPIEEMIKDCELNCLDNNVILFWKEVINQLQNLFD